MSSSLSTVEDFKTAFASIGSKWRNLRKETGKFLNKAAKQLTEPQLRILQKWISENHAINVSEQVVCMRIDRGEVVEDVAERIPASILSKISTKNVPAMNTEYRIYSPDTGAPVKKFFKDFTPNEIKSSIGIHGVQTVENSVAADPVRDIKVATANGFRIEDGYLILTVPSLGQKEVRIKISKKLAEEVSDSISVSIS